MIARRPAPPGEGPEVSDMLPIGDHRVRLCEGMTRRQWLRVGGLGAAGLVLPDLLRGRAAVPAAESASFGRAKACILCFLFGAPAQQDTWDLKPDAPAEFRGEFRPIATSVPGLQICEHLPLLARRAHRLALIRSMTHDDVDHTSATHLLLTGRPNPRGQLAEDWPNYGAILALLRRGQGVLPANVSMMPLVPNGAPRFVEQSHGQGAGWLGPIYNPMRIDGDGSRPDYPVGELALHADLTALRTGGRQQLLANLEQQQRGFEQLGNVAAMRANYE